MRFATIQFGDHRKDGSPFWDWKVFEGENPEDPKAVEIASQAGCRDFLRGNLIQDTYYIRAGEVIRDHTRSRWIQAGCSNTMSWPDQGDTLKNGLPILFSGLDADNVKALPPL